MIINGCWLEVGKWVGCEQKEGCEYGCDCVLDGKGQCDQLWCYGFV